MKRTLFLLFAALVLLGACGDPVAPDRGMAGNVLVLDVPTGNYQSAEMRIGFNSAEEFQKLKSLAPNPNDEAYVHGLVVPDSSHPLGFYLAPASTNVPAGFVPELQHSMREITDKLDSWKGQNAYVVVHIRIKEYR